MIFNLLPSIAHKYAQPRRKVAEKGSKQGLIRRNYPGS